MRAIGIDPGTKCGYAYTDDWKVHPEFSGTWDLRSKRHEGGGMRFLRLRSQIRGMIVDTEPGQCAVFYEEVRRHNGTDAAHVYGGIVATIAAVCEEYDVPYMAIPVGTIKKRATGKGNANKQAMIGAAVDAFGAEIEDDNRADALWVLQCGLEELMP